MFWFRPQEGREGRLKNTGIGPESNIKEASLFYHWFVIFVSFISFNDVYVKITTSINEIKSRSMKS